MLLAFSWTVPSNCSLALSIHPNSAEEFNRCGKTVARHEAKVKVKQKNPLSG
jgi:hypothetical protein